MLRQSGRPLDPLKVLEVRANARLLARTFQHEVDTLTADSHGRRAQDFVDVFNKVYLPRTRAIADRLANFGIEGVGLLREPLDSPGIAARLCSLIDLLHRIVDALGKVDA